MQYYFVKFLAFLIISLTANGKREKIKLINITSGLARERENSFLSGGKINIIAKTKVEIASESQNT